ncbi:hypothetical protein Q1695_015022 [Nippostrongylus brasiliensis]|nr:hypothetical protein Q1695_015022 [Nippostrongylus brasiliensis]
MTARQLLPLLIVPLSIVSSNFSSFDLCGQWNFRSANRSITGRGVVPGDIYTDLQNAKVIDDPLYGDNHLYLRWVAAENWTYSRNFELNKAFLEHKNIKLLLRGVDTVASIVVNGVEVLRTSNQFVEYFVDVKSALREKNTIEARFTSPVTYAKQMSEEYKKAYGHDVPPVCPPSIFNGECHPSFIRKGQYSFSWDWGPSIPTVGLWKPLEIVAFDDYYVDDFTWTTERTKDSWKIHGDMRVFAGEKPADVNARVIIKKLNIDQQLTAHVDGGNVAVHVPFEVSIPRKDVKLWWPSGDGKQKLYKIAVIANNREIAHKIGFRHVKLVQDFVDEKDKNRGRHFYIEVNDRPVFLKGSNWIPASMFLARNHSERVTFLLDSAAEVGMNALRVWGGGVYESNEFYEHADSAGILLWQIWRLKKHPSIFLWAGNNENEVAIKSQWWYESGYDEKKQIEDYVSLYRGVAEHVVMKQDPSRPYLLSSPSNGVETEKAGGVSENPGDTRYGDIHFYNEFIDLWKDGSYSTPRCASEYGVQSLPFGSTMRKHINASEWFYSSRQMANRQHHPGGLVTNLIMVFSHFPIPFQCSQKQGDARGVQNCEYVKTADFIDRFAYFSQAHQATTYKVQTEHYRRYRNLLAPSGEGNTMCALYWQLNDVWAAPTWSSIDIDLNWKMAHYEARRFMAPVIVVLYSVKDDIAVTVVNDLTSKIKKATLQVDMFAWTNGFQPIYTERKLIDAIDSLSAEAVMRSKNKSALRTDASEFLIRARLYDSNGKLLAPETTLHPEKLYEVDFNVLGEVSITRVEKVNDLTYSLTVNATSLSPYTWISVSKPFLGWFSDNAFTMTEPEKSVTLHLRKPVELTDKDFGVCNLRNCGVH